MKDLRAQAFEANMLLPRHGLVTLTWGNASVIDRRRGVIAIKPSGVEYAEMTAKAMVLLDLEGNTLEDGYLPSSDTATHIELYKAFPDIGAVVHTHSRWATIWSQMERELPALGTTHADHFGGAVPCTRRLTPAEVDAAYERSTGAVIAETFKNIDPAHVPAVLVAGHGPFTWGKNGPDAVHNAIVLEEVAMMAWHTLLMCPESLLPDYVLKKHFNRKHGAGAYYGQAAPGGAALK